MNKIYIVNIIAVILCFVLVIGFMTFFPRTYGFINTENRLVTQFPSFNTNDYLSGSYTKQIAEWYTDSIPYKSFFKDLVANIRSLFGVSTEVTFVDIQDGANDSRPIEEVSDPLADWTNSPTEELSTESTYIPGDIFQEDSLPDDIFQEDSMPDDLILN